MPHKRVLFSASSPNHKDFGSDPERAIRELVEARDSARVLAVWFDASGREGTVVFRYDRLDDDELADLLRDLDAIEAEVVLGPYQWKRRVG